MENKRELPKRKSTRLKNFDYSSKGAYFVTICIHDRMNILSEIVKSVPTPIPEIIGLAVGEGLAPPGMIGLAVGEGLAPPEMISSEAGERLIPHTIAINLKPCGKIAKEQLLLLEDRFPNVTVKDHVIMPDHIHAIIFLHESTGGASPSPTLNDVICAYKSLTSRSCKQKFGIEKMFQRSYAEHIIRDREDYEIRRKYIYENPMRWYYKQR